MKKEIAESTWHGIPAQKKKNMIADNCMSPFYAYRTSRRLLNTTSMKFEFTVT